MKIHRSTLTLVLAAGAWHAAGQTAIDLSRQGKLGTGTTLPVRCTVGQVFFMTNVSAGANLYACTTPNNWSVMGLPVLGGDASGTQQSITVTGIQGRGVSVAGPADQNVLRWNAADGKWEPGFVPAMGSALPPGTCTAGSLYLLNDTTNRIQQLYVCSNTNTWTMASIGSGLAANRPANCVAGQTWLSTDTAVMTYCSVTGTPGTWSATLAGPQGPSGPPGAQGPAGASGNTIWNGGGAPSASVGANGDFYLNTAANCLYGPKASGAWPGNCTSLMGGSPNFTMASGNATLASTAVPAGLTQTSVEPGQTALPNVGNLQVGTGNDVYAGGLFNPAAYGNIVGQFYRTTIFNGFDPPDNSNKPTLIGMEANPVFNGSGQHVAFGAGQTAFGAGDEMGLSSTITYSNCRIVGWGDEGCKEEWLLLQENNNTMSQAAGTVTTSSCAVTALAASVVASGSPTDIKTVAVTGSTSACSIGDWIDIDNGAFGGASVTCSTTPSGPASDYCHESVKITGKTSSTISALFKLAHASGAPVAPSPVIAVTGGNQYADWGQDAIVVDMTATPITGTAYVSAQSLTTPYATITGVGTTWSSIPVSGTALQYCAAFTADNVTSAPFSSGNPLVSWFPIQAFTGNTTATVGLAYTGSAIGSGNQGAIAFRPCSITSQLTVNYGSTTESVNGLVMRSGGPAWTAGHTISQIISPNSSVGAGIQVAWAGYGPHATVPVMYTGLNLGTVQAGGLLAGFGTPLSATVAGYKNGITLPSTQVEQIASPQISMSSVFAALNTSATAIPNNQLPNGGGVTGDVKAINWLGDAAHDQVAIYPGPTNTGFWINNPSGPRLTLAYNEHAIATIDASGNDQGNVYKLPNASGTIFAPQGGSNIERTIPSNATQTVDIGLVNPSAYTDYAVDLWICSGANQCGRYFVVAGAYIPGDNAWKLVAPITTSATGLFQLEASAGAGPGSSLGLRLRGLSNFGALVSVTLAAEGIRTIAFVPDSTVAVTTAPTAYWDSAFVTQTGNKLLLNYTSTASATIDPTNLTAPQTIKLPNVSGTPMLYQANTTGSTAFAPAGSNCPAANCVTPYTWMQVTTSDGSTGYIPVFK